MSNVLPSLVAFLIQTKGARSIITLLASLLKHLAEILEQLIECGLDMEMKGNIVCYENDM